MIARLTAIRYEAEAINLYELSPFGRAPFPTPTPGSHIDIHLPNGIVRQYSLISAGGDTENYIIAVKRDQGSRGGSSFMHEDARVGMTFPISEPRNSFPLDEAARHTVFIAGGIGITPIYAMIGRMIALDRSWELHYGCRHRSEAGFLASLAENENCRLVFDNETGAIGLDIARIVSSAPSDSEFYCCGPLPMLQSFEAAAAHIPPNRIHVEYFKPPGSIAPPSLGGFHVSLAKNGAEFFVPPDRTILEVLLENGIDAAHSCREGICGACEVQVLAGKPDHRDYVLTDAEKMEGRRMMICCSRALVSPLVIKI